MKIADLLDRMPEGTSTMAALEELAKTDVILWAALNRRVKGEALIFDNARNLSEESLGEVKRTVIKSDYERELKNRLNHHRPFLKQPLRDDHPHKVTEKGRQMGVSENMVSEEVHFAINHPGTKLIHTFPREKQLIDFSITRIAPVFTETPRLAAMLGIPNQIFNKRIGDSYLMLRSAWESNLGEGIDADMVVLDEKDRMRDKIEFAFRECLKSSKFGLMRELSTPTLPNHGIDIPFRASDQRVWMVKCEKCGEFQEITWTENIVQVIDFPVGTKELPPESYEYLCKKTKCRGRLDRVFSGQWVAKYPDRKNIRGYHIPQLIAPWISATRVMQDKIDLRFLEIWLCYVIGVPATGDMEMVGDADCMRACASHQFILERTKDWTHITAGIDWGTYNWVLVMGRSAINGRLYILNIGVFEDTNEPLESTFMVERFLAPYVADLVIADAGYGKDRNAYLLRKMCPNGTEGRFYAQWYNPSQKSSRTFVPEWSDPQRARVLVDRTLTLKNLCSAVKAREFGFPDLTLDMVQLLIRHLKALAPFREIDDDTKEIVETVKSSGDDHLAHACGSALLAMEKLSKQSRFGFEFMG